MHIYNRRNYQNLNYNSRYTPLTVAVTAAIGPPHCIPIRFTATNNEIAYTILPQSMAVKSEIYVPIFFLLNLNVLYIKPLTNPYTASSIIINGNLPTAGIPVKTELIIGENNPTKNPNTGPKTNPPSNTGMCIGKKKYDPVAALPLNEMP